VAVAQSHVEAWKVTRRGEPASMFLVLEDDVWFRAGAAAAIDRGWRAAQRRQAAWEKGVRAMLLSLLCGREVE